MSDYNSGLPVRTQADGTDERLHVKIVDGTSPSVNQVSVDSDKNLHVEIHGDDPAGVDRVVRTAENGAIATDGVYNAATNTVPASTALTASTRAASPDSTTTTQRLTSVTNSTKRLLDVSIHDESGAAFSEDNPLPVTWVDSEGTEINDYATAAAVAAGASSNHDYPVTALKRLKLSQIIASGSGKIKVEVQVETAAASGTYNTKFVAFNSTSAPNIVIPVNENITVAAGVKVRIIVSNRDLQPQDVYSTICGHEIT